MRLRSLLAPLALASVSTTLTLLLLEAGFRLAHVPVGTVQINRRLVRPSANPRLEFELRPGAEARAEVVYRINSLGMRSPEPSEAKPPGTTRIAVLGDSIAFGYWVAEQDAFPAQLQGLLNQAGGTRYEVLNFGVPGYNLEQETERLRLEVLRFSPDLVILAFCLNDLRAFSHEYGLVLDRQRRRASLPGWLVDGALGHSLLLAWLEYRLAQLEARREFVRARNPLRGGPFPGSPAEQWRELSSRFGVIAALLAGGRVPGLVAVFPLLGHRFARYPYREEHRAVVETARELGLRAVDLLGCFEAYDSRDVRVDVIHPNPLGHRIAAHAVLDALCRERLLCAGPQRAPRRACTAYRPEEFPRVRGF